MLLFSAKAFRENPITAISALPVKVLSLAYSPSRRTAFCLRLHYAGGAVCVTAVSAQKTCHDHVFSLSQSRVRPAGEDFSRALPVAVTRNIASSQSHSRPEPWEVNRGIYILISPRLNPL